MISLNYSKIGRKQWKKGDKIIHVVESSQFGHKLRITWYEKWMKDYAVIYDYSKADGPVCVVPIPILFSSDFVKIKRESEHYVNSKYWWTQLFPREHKLSKLVLKYCDRWDLL